MRKNKSKKKNKEYWEFVEETARNVSSWPAWKRGGTVDVYLTEFIEAKSEERQRQERST